MSDALSVRVRLPLDRFDLDVDVRTTHRVTGIFGASGSGKTTLLETIAGLRRGARGHVALGDETWLDDERRVRIPPERRGVGYVPQDSLLFPHLDVLGNLRAGRGRALAGGHDPDAVMDTTVRVLDLAPLLRRTVTTLSGGERQRVALGRALCSGPRLLLLDEPLASLDAALRRRVLPFLQRVQAEFAIPILLVSHDPVEVQALCEDLIVLREGRMIARGEPRAVLTDPAVFPLAETEGFENVLPAVVAATRDGTTQVRLGSAGAGPALTVPRSTLPVGHPLLLSVPADEIVLALEPPAGLSARNAVPARVERVEAVGPIRLVTARVADDTPPLVIEVTDDARAELQLAPGTALYLLIKTTAITLYEDPSAGG
ncbi:molybdenum ABC transporter ATP-binding protein [Longimicrobium sp.]|uniref:molybdenum ABC transporter ATP-binding protein n=1 Tax=Longimicrobium sp. TaxID=2029185 RepID=UPI002E2FA75F|nr:molybdenum ABC transporter ATP-binding protein [Longimicrobium sp.]HEX6037481.1 molybdenum ABC transporter ATP-binding protein [Longimicrobium sp.]